MWFQLDYEIWLLEWCVCGFSVAVVMLLLFYFFAIIGMEVFAPYTDQLMNCCR